MGNRKIRLAMAAGVAAAGLLLSIAACNSGPTREAVLAEAHRYYDCLEAHPEYHHHLVVGAGLWGEGAKFETRAGLLYHAVSVMEDPMAELGELRRQCWRFGPSAPAFWGR